MSGLSSAMIHIRVIVFTFFAASTVFGHYFGHHDVEPLDPDELKKVYDRYVESEFAEVAHELAKRVGEHPVLVGYVADEQLEKPWTHSMSLTLLRAWRFHTDYIARKDSLSEVFEVLMLVLENDDVGVGRSLALGEIKTRFDFGYRPANQDKNLPPLDETLLRLEKIVRDPSEDAFLRRSLIPILYEHGDPNEYLGLAIELTSTGKSPIAIAEAFRLATPVRNAGRLTAANRTRYLHHAFKLLKEVDDRKSGTGYFLAMHIGDFVGVEPVRPGQGAFAPNQKLPKYQGKHGLRDSFFQQTVDNAMKWWGENRLKYQSKMPSK